MISSLANLTLSLLILTCVSLPAALAQNPVFPDTVFLKKIKSEYPFIQLNKNTLELFHDADWAPFFEKMERMRQGEPGQLHVVHIGGSHVQAGFLSNQIEKKLKTHFPPSWTGEKGFLFPYQLSNTNAPEGYRIRYTGKWEGCRSSVRTMDCSWGVSGINAQTSTPFSSVMIRPEDHLKQSQPFCTVRILCDLGSSSMLPEPYNPLCPVYTEVDTVAGVIEWHFDEEQDHLEFLLLPTENQDSGSFVLQGLQFISEQPGVVMHPIGVNGASLSSYLKCQGFQTQLSNFRTDLVIFAIGVNDASVPQAEFSPEKFEMQYDSLIMHFKQINPEVRILFITNNDTYYKRKYPNRNGLRVKEAMYRLAEKHQGGVWNLFDIMGGLGSIQKWQLNGLAKKDKVHFTAAGYQLTGDLLVEALLAKWQTYQLTQFNSP
jgi:lysophospholipase L1-like esterase